MKNEDFDTLNTSAQMALMFAMHIRNEMEDFHCQHLSDEQMKELNPIIRQALYEMFRCLSPTTTKKSSIEKKYTRATINYLIQMIPNYWELPSEEAFQKSIKSFRENTPNLST